MNEIEKQILKNQSTILLILGDRFEKDLNLTILTSLADRMRETFTILNPPKEQTLPERTHDALSQSSEVKKE